MRIINWFEIPVGDMARARTFYEAVFQLSLTPESCSGIDMCVFPYHPDFTGGALAKAENLQPGPQGPVIYLNAGEALDPVLARVEPAGGCILMPRTAIGENGFIALFRDSEGNQIGLHAMA